MYTKELSLYEVGKGVMAPGVDGAGTPPGVGVLGTTVSVGCLVFLVGALRVVIGVRLKGVPVAMGVASACKSGQGCRATEYREQFDGSEQIFK